MSLPSAGRNRSHCLRIRQIQLAISVDAEMAATTGTVPSATGRSLPERGRRLS